MNNAAIDARGLTKRFGRTTAVHDVDLTIARGETVGLLGANGAGKTTIVKLLLGLVHPTFGAADVLGRPIGDREARRHVGYLPELFRSPEWLTAREAIDLHGRLIGLTRDQRRAAATDVLERVGLGTKREARIGTFSKGMQQRLGLAIALTGSPELVFLDEPTSALDPIGRSDVRAIIEDLHRCGTTVLLNSHLLTEVERVCDRIIIVDGGTIIAQGTLDEMLGRRTALRLKLGAADAAVDRALARRGNLHREAPWWTVDNVAEDTVPAIVAELVGLGVDVFAVELQRATLEERFVALLQPAADAAAHDRVADPA